MPLNPGCSRERLVRARRHPDGPADGCVDRASRSGPLHAGPYQDWYLFAYGQDYATGLEDLRALTGPAPLLPRSAFGVWFSRYYPYSESDYHTLIAQFRANRVPLDTLSIDTDFKRENNAGAAAAAARRRRRRAGPAVQLERLGMGHDAVPRSAALHRLGPLPGHLARDQHPPVDRHERPRVRRDRRRRRGRSSPDGGSAAYLKADPTAQCMTCSTGPTRGSSAAYFALQQPFARQGVDLFWLDWCCDASQPVAPGLTADTWINSLYAREQRARGCRWPAFSRIGGVVQRRDGSDGDRTEGDGGTERSPSTATRSSSPATPARPGRCSASRRS